MSHGDYQEGIDATKRSIELRISLAGNADTSLVSVYNNLGNGFIYLDDYANAKIFYLKAIEVIKQGIIKSEKKPKLCATGILQFAIHQ